MILPKMLRTDSVLYHGDAAEILPQLKPVDLIVTSPPYDSLRDYGGTEFDFDAMADACVGVLKEGGVLVWVVGDAFIDGSKSLTSFRHALGFRERGLKVHDHIIYQKRGAGFSTPNRYLQVFEHMFVFSKSIPKAVNLLKDRKNKTAGNINNQIRTKSKKDGSIKLEVPPHKRTVPESGIRYNIWEYPVGIADAEFPYEYKHPAIFPYALARDHIISWSNPGDTVLDPMAGSGTTMRAAVDLGRVAVGVEIHEPYCEMIEKRMAQQNLGI